MNRILILLLATVFTVSLHAQTQKHVCGLPVEHDDKLVERLKANLEYLERQPADFRSGDTRILPVVFHIIRPTNGEGGIAETRCYDQICNLNEYYDAQGTSLQFMVDEINYINNDFAFSNPSTSVGENIMAQSKRAGKINIYIPQNADSPGSPGIVLGFYDPNRDWIVMRPSEVSGFSSTLHHEMGHFLSLEHPFRGWDYEPYDPDVHGVQVGNFASSTGYPFNILNEKQDGSNCAISGDLVCDTPPDYNHFDGNWGCNYSGGAKDPNGELIDPDETNIMSYFNDCDPHNFSSKQLEIMNADVDNRLTIGSLILPSQVHPGTVPPMGALIEPINSAEVPNNANIFFDWLDLPNATEYYLEIDFVNTFSFMPARFKVTESQFFFDGSALLNNANYNWRVRGYNAYDYCSGWSDVGKFKSTEVTSTVNFTEVKDLEIYPNPSQAAEAIMVELEAEETFNAQISVLNNAGKLLYTQEHNLITGSNQLSLNIPSQVAGLYFIQIRTKSGTIEKKWLAL